MPYKPSNGRPAAEIDAQVAARMDAMPARALCAFCPTWSFEGTVLECRTASATHRARYHRDTTRIARKRRRGPVSRFNLGAAEDRENGNRLAAEVERMLARREAEQAA